MTWNVASQTVFRRYEALSEAVQDELLLGTKLLNYMGQASAAARRYAERSKRNMKELRFTADTVFGA